VDLAAAAQYAGVRVRLYDLDPATLGPDLDSLRAALSRGADAIVVAHLFGYPADVDGVRCVANEYGIPIIEDAAQGAGGRLNGRRLGSLGDLSLVSFGRGKGLCAGGGGALLAPSEQWESRIAALRLAKGDRGWGGLAKAGLQWALGRPALYALPSMIPWLRLGQMVYHPATEPRAMDVTANALLTSAFSLEAADLETRRTNASALSDLLGQTRDLYSTTTIAGAAPGYLRLPIRDNSGSREADSSLGIARPYPTTMLEMPELRSSLHEFEPEAPGAVILRDRLFTLPTHRHLTAGDIHRLRRWITADKSHR
jgi:dTDP-4-amino-4,6-dideoxygalactose transaminase